MSQKVAPLSEQQQQECAPTLASLHPWDVAVVFDSLSREKCGHSLQWNRYEDIPTSCPTCQSSIVLICDGLSGNKDNKQVTGLLVFFKYNKQSFLLSLQKPKRKAWWDRQPCTAQRRMAYALGMNESNGIKVLCKGKVLYPNMNHSAIDISNHLVEISRQDLENGKSSLVVMGTRQGQGLHEPRQALWSIVLGMGVAFVYGIMKLIQGTALYLYSFIKPLPPPEERQRRSE